MRSPDNQKPDPVVFLVDDKTRDLDIAVLIAWHLKRIGIECYLEPLEAFRAVLGEYRPGMIIFNHMQGSHMSAWSRRLADIGVLTAVHLNEGILYNEEHRRFMAGKHHSDAHIDYYFCWNEAHKDALRKEKVGQSSEIVVTGVPRFDFYFEPWSKLTPGVPRKSSRPRVLLCTNFQLAKFADIPGEFSRQAFGSIASRVPLYENVWDAIRSQKNSRDGIFRYIRALAAEDKYEIILRPHPRERTIAYTDIIDTLPLEQRKYVSVDAESNITSLILGSDVQISCETCTTTMEAWIARKPTIELIFDKNPLLYRAEQAGMNLECTAPESLPKIVDEALKGATPVELWQHREKHLAVWCAGPKGDSSRQFAQSVADAITTKRASDWTKLNASDLRRARKLSGYRRLNHGYQFDPLLKLKHWLFPKRYVSKVLAYRKSIRPRDVTDLKRQFETVLGSGDAAKR